MLSLLCVAHSQEAFSQRDYYNYELKRGATVVYRGQTNDPQRRQVEHLRDGKDFTHMRVLGNAKTRQGALNQERKDLATYRRSHNGENPEYNQTDHG